MGESSVEDLGNLMYISIPLVILANVVSTIFADDMLKQNYLLVLYACFCFLLVCCVTTLSSVCVLRRKAKAARKPLWKLKDSDLEYEETEVVQEFEPYSLWGKMEALPAFLGSRCIYRLVAQVGAFFIIMATVLKVASLYSAAPLKKDFESSAIVLGISGIFLECVVWQTVDTPVQIDLKTTYKPFEEFIRIPMKVFIPKVALHLSKKIFCIASLLFYQFSVIYGLATVRYMPEHEIKRFQLALKREDIHVIMIIGMVLANVFGLLMILESLWMACQLAKEDLLLTFEKNWRRNLIALDCFLHDKEVATLEELRDAFLEKRQKEQLTEEEQKALKYIEIPLWRTKQSYVLKPAAIDRTPKMLEINTPPTTPVKKLVQTSRTTTTLQDQDKK